MFKHVPRPNGMCSGTGAGHGHHNSVLGHLPGGKQLRFVKVYHKSVILPGICGRLYTIGLRYPQRTSGYTPLVRLRVNLRLRSEERNITPIELDVHIHTIASGHAYVTITGMASAVSQQGLKLLGITEHTRGIAESCKDIYFLDLKVVPRQMFGVQLMLGAGISTIDHKGTLGLRERYMKHLDLRIAEIHKVCYKPGSPKENIDTVLGVIANPYVDIISHPDDGSCPPIYEEVVAAIKRYHTLLGISNNPSRTPTRKHARENTLVMLDLRHKQQVPVIASSDAHFTSDIINLNHIQPLLEEADFPERLMINHNLEQFREFIAHNRAL